MVYQQFTLAFVEPASPDLDRMAAAYAIAEDLYRVLTGEACPVHVNTSLAASGRCDVCDLEEQVMTVDRRWDEHTRECAGGYCASCIDLEEIALALA